MVGRASPPALYRVRYGVPATVPADAYLLQLFHLPYPAHRDPLWSETAWGVGVLLRLLGRRSHYLGAGTGDDPGIDATPVRSLFRHRAPHRSVVPLGRGAADRHRRAGGLRRAGKR